MTLQSFSGVFPRPSLRRLGLVLLAAGLFLLAGCDQTGQMNYQPKYNPYAASPLFANGTSAQNPIPGTVPYSADGSILSPARTGLDETGAAVKTFPVPVTKELVQKGQERFGIYCTPCHGVKGDGNGKATGFGFPKPPDLLASNAKGLSDGDIFAIITNGRGKMFSYGYRVKADERWAVISYIRAMQLKNGPVDPASLTADEINQIGKQ